MFFLYILQRHKKAVNIWLIFHVINLLWLLTFPFFRFNLKKFILIQFFPRFSSRLFLLTLILFYFPIISYHFHKNETRLRHFSLNPLFTLILSSFPFYFMFSHLFYLLYFLQFIFSFFLFSPSFYLLFPFDLLSFILFYFHPSFYFQFLLPFIWSFPLLFLLFPFILSCAPTLFYLCIFIFFYFPFHLIFSPSPYLLYSFILSPLRHTFVPPFILSSFLVNFIFF